MRKASPSVGNRPKNICGNEPMAIDSRPNSKSVPLVGFLPFGALLAVGGFGFLRLLGAPNPQVELAGYATSLQGRTSGQKHNARLSAEAINGKTVAPGAIFSFNR